MTRPNLARIVGVLALAMFANVAQAQPRFSTPDVRIDDSEQLLVMRNGSIMRGQIKTISTGHLVKTDVGHVLITFDQARFAAASLDDAYLRLRLEVRTPTVAIHRDLAEWCLRHNLHRQAERELRDALRIDPANETVRSMLDRIQHQIARSEPQPEATKPATFSNVADKPDARSLSGLTQETAKYFVSAIQPLMISNCANARCHGSASETDFTLMHVRMNSGTHRMASERNLAAMLKYMDLNEPDQSKLLDVATSSHVGVAMFSGRSGFAHVERLRSWVTTVADELNPNRKLIVAANRAARESTSTSATNDSASQFTSPTRRSETPTPTVVGFPTALADSSSTEGTLDRTGTDIPIQDLLNSTRVPHIPIGPEAPGSSREHDASAVILRSNFQQLLDEKHPDVFDPDDFNLQYSGKNRSQP